MMRVSFFVALCLVAACGGGDDRGEVGAACVDGGGCVKDAFCLVATSDPAAGVCTAIPADCDPSEDCSCLYAAATCMYSGCFLHNGDATVTCQQTTRRQVGETCSEAVDCAGDLYCRTDAIGAIGECRPLPAECGTDPDCQCLEAACEYTRCAVSTTTSMQASSVVVCR